MRSLFVLVALAPLACDSGFAGPDPNPADVIVNAQVNIQLGDTPAGQQPTYLATGEVTATQDGVPVTAITDSVVIHYRISNGAFVRHTRRNSLPFADELPFTAVAGQSYQIRANVWGTGTGTDGSVTATDEWIATGVGIAAGGN